MKRILSSVLVGLFPTVALAQVYSANQGIGGLFTLAGAYMDRIVPFIIALAVVFFIYNVFVYAIVGASDEEKRTEARTRMVWGIIGIFVMVSVWGLVAILQSTFNLGVTTNLGNQIPRI